MKYNHFQNEIYGQPTFGSIVLQFLGFVAIVTLFCGAGYLFLLIS